MDEEAGILREIVENPDDVTHRLVYADWLEEHGQGRLGEFIRAHCALRPFLLNPEDADRHYPVAIDVVRIHKDLYRGLLAAFIPVAKVLRRKGVPLETVLVQQFSFWVYCGLIEEVAIYGGTATTAFLRHAKTIFARVPIRKLTLSRAASVHDAFSFPYAGNVKPISRAMISTLLTIPELARLRILNLGGLRLGDELGRSILRCPHLTQLQLLTLDDNLIETVVSEALHERFGEALVLTPYSPNDEDEVPF